MNGPGPSRLATRRSARQHRLTSLILLPLTVWLAPALPRLPDLTYDSFIAWLTQPVNWTLLLMFIIVATHHALLGLRAVMDDYLHSQPLKRHCVNATRILLPLVGLAGASATLKIILAHPT